MGQYWEIINIDKRVSTGGLGVLGGIFHLHGVMILDRLRGPVPSDELKALNARIESCAKAPQDAGLGQLTMATELLVAVFEAIHDFRDAAALCLTNKTLWSIGNEHVLKVMKKAMAVWEGDRLVCIGDYTTFLPEGVLTPDEEASLDRRCSSRSNPDSFVFYEYVSHRYSGIGRYAAPYVNEKRDLDLMWSLSRYERKAYKLLVEAPSSSYSLGEVLCNLTQRQYVRRELLERVLTAAKEETAHLVKADEDAKQAGHMKYWQELNVGDVLLSRICWSEDDSTSMSYEGGINKGVWVGNRFAIVNSMRRFHERFGAAEDWTDVSNETGWEFVRICRCEYGEQWPN